MNDLDEFLEIQRDSSRIPSPALVERLAAEYPFYAMPAALLLDRGGNMLDPAMTRHLSEIVALNSSDPTLLFSITTNAGRETASIEDETAVSFSAPATEDAIDTFLRQYGNISDEDNELLERLIFNPVPDYSSQLAKDEPTETSLSDLLGQINTPVDISTPEIKPETDIPQQPENNESGLRDTTFSESLAKIYIKQHKFDKALEIISGLYLKFPEKSIYFADQMRFLRKLIINRNFNSQK